MCFTVVEILHFILHLPDQMLPLLDQKFSENHEQLNFWATKKIPERPIGRFQTPTISPAGVNRIFRYLHGWMVWIICIFKFKLLSQNQNIAMWSRLDKLVPAIFNAFARSENSFINCVFNSCCNRNWCASMPTSKLSYSSFICKTVCITSHSNI